MSTSADERPANNSALLEAVQIVGGQTELARKLTQATGRPYSQAHIWNWLYRPGAKLPGEVVIPIEQIVDGQVSRGQLRPDIFCQLAG